MRKFPALVDYVERVRTAVFPDEEGTGGKGGSAMDAIDSSRWLEPPTAQSRGRRGWWGGGGGAKKKQRTAKEIRFRRRSRYAVLIAVGAVLSYLLTGEVLVLAFGDGAGDEDGDGDGDEDGDGEETGTEEVEVEMEESLDDDDDEELEPLEDDE